MISIVIPIYNVENYLSDCLNSILKQSFFDWEAILVNDGSTDKSGLIANQYARLDSRFKVFHKDNGGLSDARNFGIDKVSGELLTFVDSDDMLLPDSLKSLYIVMKETGADIVQGKAIIGKNYYYPKVKDLKIKTFTPESAIEDVLYQKDLLPSACGKLYKTDLFSTIRFQKGIFYEDLDCFYKIFHATNKIVYLDSPVYFYRIVEGSITNKWSPRRLDVLKVTEDLESFISKYYPALFKAAKDRRLSANFNMLVLCANHGVSEQAEMCWNLIKKYRTESLFNKKTRLKNKVGILISYLGYSFFYLLSKVVYNLR